jgi:hypoxanthine phosphoribosyltransferase
MSPDAPPKLYVDSRTLTLESIRLARRIWQDGFRPDYLIGIWRGGTPPGIVMHEFFRLQGHDPYHTTIKTQSYRGMQRGKDGVEVKGIEHVIDVVNSTDRLLLVDDVFDTGHTMHAVLAEIRRRARRNAPECRVATVYYKPLRNETSIEPEYWQVETDDWIVFPHEIDGLEADEIRAKGCRVAEAVLDPAIIL